MAKRRKSTNSTTPRTPREPSLIDLLRQDTDAKIERARKKVESRTRTLDEMTRNVSDKDVLRELKAHGFFIRNSGVVIDGPRNAFREPILGAHFDVHSGGVVSYTVGSRHDYIYGMTESEKKRFAENPQAVEIEIRNRLANRFPLMAKYHVESRLQWGAYQGTKEFSPNYFTKTYLLSFMLKAGEVDKDHRKIDALTGFHFVVHVE